MRWGFDGVDVAGVDVFIGSDNHCSMRTLFPMAACGC
jgi:hypothetical protein